MKKVENFIKSIVFVAAFLGLSFGSTAQDKKEETVKIKTSAVCSMCKEKIEKGLAYEKGVKDVNLDFKTAMLTVTYKTGKTNIENLKLAVTKLGYDADDKKADQKAYDKLPACCKKGSSCGH